MKRRQSVAAAAEEVTVATAPVAPCSNLVALPRRQVKNSRELLGKK